MKIRSLVNEVFKKIRRQHAGAVFVMPRTDRRGNMEQIRFGKLSTDAVRQF